MTTICQLLHSLSIGGAEVLAARIGRTLSDRFRFVFACLDELGPLGRELADDRFTVHELGRGDGLDYRCVRSLRKLLRAERVDLVHAHQFTPYFYATLARAPFRRPPVLFTEHGRFHPDYRRPKRVMYNRVATSRRDQIVAVGQAVREALIAHEGFPEKRIEIVYNGIDLEPYQRADEKAAAAVRTEFSIPPEAFLIVQVARLDPIKDHQTAIRGVARLAESHPDARLLIVGDGPERKAIATAAATLAPEHVILAGMRRDIPDFLTAADAFLLTSVSEGIPLTVIEAMAARRPVVSTDVGGLGEVVVPEQTGLLAPAGDWQRLAQSLKRLRENPEWAAALGAAGQGLAEERFSEQAMVGTYAEMFSAMAGSRRRVPANSWD